ATLTVTANNATRQYSDPNPTFTGMLTGVVNGDNITANYSTTATATSPVGTYSITATLSDPGNKLSNYNVTKTPGTLTVAQEDARTYYTGLVYVTTASASSTSATVVLSATVKDITAVPSSDPLYSPSQYDGFPGDIRTAQLEFYIVETNKYVAATIGLVNPNDTTVGTATATTTLTTGPSGGQPYTIRAVLGRNGLGKYARDDSREDTVVDVIQPQAGSIGGGGFLVNSASKGTYAGDPGLNTNFGLNVKFNKSGTNLQGNVNIIARSN